MKKIAIIPTLLTLGNAVCGFAAVAYAGKIDVSDPATEYYFALSGWLIVAAMVFDAFDGYVARLSKSASRFGGELDSLADTISFGVAPGFLLLRMGPGWEPRPLLHQLLAGIASLYLVCAILRLARFNVENSPDPSSHKRFRGLPSPGAAGAVASLGVLRVELPAKWPVFDLALFRGAVEVWAMLGGLVVALLMVSQLPYPHLTKKVLGSLRGHRHFSHLIEVIVIAFIFVLVRELAVVLVFWAYALGVPLRFLAARALHPDVLATPEAAGADDHPSA